MVNKWELRTIVWIRNDDQWVGIEEPGNVKHMNTLATITDRRGLDAQDPYLTGLKVLLIEDDDLVLTSIADYLKGCGYQVWQARNGEEGVQIARLRVPDLVVCDLNMPGMDGFAVLKAVQSHPELAETPFLFLSGSSTPRVVRQGMILGADDYLVKPISPEVLEASIRARAEKFAAQKRRAQKRVDAAYEMLSSVIGMVEKPVRELGANNDVLIANARNTSSGPEAAITYLRRQSVLIDSTQAFLLNLRFLNRNLAGRLQCHPRPIDLGAFLPMIAEQYLPSARVVCDPEIDATMIADPVLLRRAIENLLANALMYSTARVSVRVNASQNGAVSISVTDQGPGISDEDQANLFKPFFRGKNSEGWDGSGLGLAITRICMRLHGGDVVMDTEPGHGTTATLVIPPRVQEPSQPALPSGGDLEVHEHEDADDDLPVNVLIVGPTPQWRFDLIERLHRAVHLESLEQATSLTEASESLGLSTFDLIFVDADSPIPLDLPSQASIPDSAMVVVVGESKSHAGDSSFEIHHRLSLPLSLASVSQFLAKFYVRRRTYSALNRSPLSPGSETLWVKTPAGRKRLPLSEIRLIKACGEYSQIYWGKGENTLIRKPMKTWEVGIPQPPFVRVHRKALVNLRFFDRKVTRSDGEVMLVLKGDPEEIPVSIRRRGAVSRMLKEMKLSNES